MNKSHIEIYKIIAFLTILVGLFLGIILGNTFTTNVEDSYNNIIEKFNTMLMFEIWGVSFFISIIILGIYSICARLDMLIKENPNHIITKVVKKKESTTRKTRKNKKEESEYNW